MGAGFAGLCMAIKLKEEGINDFLLLEKAAEVGGTWRDNHYPGAACDVQSHLYSFSFAPKNNWSKRYANWEEIQSYLLQVTADYQLRPHLRLQQEMIAARFDVKTGRWQVETQSGEHYRCRFLVVATGPLHHPHIPRIPGINRFAGTQFHSANWDHRYDFTNKRVISVGTGASAIQYAPEIAARVAHLSIFQRTPAWVIPRDSRPYTPWERQMLEMQDWYRRLYRARLYWSNESRLWPAKRPALARSIQQLLKLWVRWQVHDGGLASQLIPDYTFGCKRVLISNAWYPMFNRSNVQLVTEGIREIRKHSVVTWDSREHPVDCIIWGTGFQVDPRSQLQHMPIHGLPGHELLRDWRRGCQAYLGVMVSGYPNFFQLLGPNSVLGHNSLVFMIEAQVHFIIQCLRMVREQGSDYFQVKPEVQKIFNHQVQQELAGSVWQTGCQSWYQDSEGKNYTLWPWSTWRFWLKTREVHTQDFVFSRVRAIKTVRTVSGRVIQGPRERV